MNIKRVGNFCGWYRKYMLNMTLVEFTKRVKGNYKNISRFENGRSTNIKYLEYYYQVGTYTDRTYFAINVFKHM